MIQASRQSHPFPPIFDSSSRVLIVGSFPSVQSRKVGFYYGNPRNRFWPVLAALFKENVPEGSEQRQAFVLRNRIALFDVLESCEIAASSDASIRRAVPNHFDVIFESAQIQRVFANGRSAFQFYERYISHDVQYLPSTSPANAAWQLPQLIEAWKVILPYLQGTAFDDPG